MLTKEHAVTCQAIAHVNERQLGRYAAVVRVRQRPSSASDLVFTTIEEETGIANIVVRPKVLG
jgi:error-prone DNA polymerase